MSFADLKKQSRAGSLTEKLIKQVEKLNSGEGGSDERFWKPEVDKAGNGYAVIRFLPAPEGCELPGPKYGVMLSKVLVVGTSKTL